MKKFLLTIALFAGTLGLMSATPSQAQAQFRVGAVNTGFRVGPYGYFNAFNRPSYGLFYNPYNVWRFNYHPGGFRATITPWGTSRMWASPSIVSYRANLLWGSWLTLRSPAYFGINTNPFFNYTTIYRPSTTVRIPLTAGYAGYVPPAYIIR